MADLAQQVAHQVAGLDWPPLISIAPNDVEADAKKTLYEAQVKAFADWLQAQIQAEIAAQQAARTAATDEQKAVAAGERAREDAQTAADVARRTAEYANYYTVFQAVQTAYLGAARDSVTNAQSRAQYVVTAAGSIATLYTGLLGLVFGLSSAGHELPERGVWAGFFLGLAIVLATFYLAYLIKRPSGAMTQPSAALRVDAVQRVYDFVAWSRDAVLTRRYFLQCSVISLGVGVAFLPAAFTTLGNASARWLALLGLLVVFGIPGLTGALLHE